MMASLPRLLVRGLAHAGLGVALAAASLLLPGLAVTIACVALTLCFLLLELARLRTPFLNRWMGRRLAVVLKSEEQTKVTGATYFLIGATVANLAFGGRVGSLAIVYLALGDPCAAAVGRRLGRVRLWGRTVEGSLACLIVCLVAAIPAAAVLDEVHLVPAVVGAFAASVFQALPLRLNDNFTIPVGAAASMAIAEACLHMSGGGV